MTLLLSMLLACSDQEVTYSCTEAEVLQECDSNGDNCVDVEDCMAQGLMCHAEMGHCMAMEEDTSMEDTAMNMQ
jgi:hypothetical protein